MIKRLNIDVHPFINISFCLNSGPYLFPIQHVHIFTAFICKEYIIYMFKDPLVILSWLNLKHLFLWGLVTYFLDILLKPDDSLYVDEMTDIACFALSLKDIFKEQWNYKKLHFICSAWWAKCLAPSELSPALLLFPLYLPVECSSL